MIAWRDGLVRGPDGVYRQLPQRETWASALFVTRDGVVRRRQYDPVNATWAWYEETPVRGRAGFSTKEGWKDVDRCVATAWLRRAPGGSSELREKVFLVGRDAEGTRAEQLAWLEAEDAEPAVRRETWRPLHWRCGVVPCDPRYQVSNRGRLRSPKGAVTAGFWWGGTRWAGVRGGLLVDLLAAAGLRAPVLPPAIRVARNALATGHTAAELAAALRVQESTAWAYLCRAAQSAAPCELREFVRRFEPRLWRRLHTRREIGGSLTELARDLGVPVSSALRLARMAAVA
jgi:hypothetical protein